MTHYLVFTGHMIDARDREKPRFPGNKEEAVKEKIYECLLLQKEKIKQPLQGVASAACGGDILFHEACEKLSIPTEIYLPMLAEEFKENSVSFAGNKWDERFESLIKKVPLHILPETNENTANDNIYELTNKWMLNTVIAAAGNNFTLIALWNLDIGDGKGGTQHLVNIAKEKNAEVDIININEI